jgi:hypothetical protein
VETYRPALPDVQSFYRLYGPDDSSVWLTWDTVVDAAPGPIADETDFRLYYTGAGVPAKTNYAMASAVAPYPSQYLEMGVPQPTVAPTVASASSVAPLEYRTYIYTFVSTFGALTEESDASPASAIIGVDIPGTTAVTISGLPGAPAGAYNITHINIYRSVAGATTASYEFVTQIPIGEASYVDTEVTAELGEVIGSLGWQPPPSNMQGLVSVGNGFLAGFFGNTVCLSVPYAPHAWPVAYQYAIPYTIVGLSVTDGYLVVMTTRFPYLLSGVDPSSMTVQQLPNDEPCLAKSTIASDENGVVYASPNGLMSIGAAGAAIITDGLFRRSDWQAVNPAEMKGLIFDAKYFGIYVGGFYNDASLVISRDDVPALSTLTLNASAAYKDSITGNLFIVNASDNNIYQVDADPNNPYTFTWQSKRFVTPQATALSAMKVDANYDQISQDAIYEAMIAAIEAANAAVFASGLLGAVNAASVNHFCCNGSAQQSLPPDNAIRNVVVTLYGDEELIGVFNMTSFDPIRLPAFRARSLYFVVTGNVYTTSISFATTVRSRWPQTSRTRRSGADMGAFVSIPPVPPTADNSTLLRAIVNNLQVLMGGGSDSTSSSGQNVSAGAGALTLNYTAGGIAQVQLTSNITAMSLVGAPSGSAWSMQVAFVVGGVGGYTVAWPTAWYAAGGGEKPVVSRNVGAIDLFTLTGLPGGQILITPAGQGFTAGS